MFFENRTYSLLYYYYGVRESEHRWVRNSSKYLRVHLSQGLMHYSLAGWLTYSNVLVKQREDPIGELTTFWWPNLGERRGLRSKQNNKSALWNPEKMGQLFKCAHFWIMSSDKESLSDGWVNARLGLIQWTISCRYWLVDDDKGRLWVWITCIMDCSNQRGTGSGIC